MKQIKWAAFILALTLGVLWGFQSVEQEPRKVVDVFRGQINRSNIGEATLLGSITYDRNCLPVENGLTQCDAGVKTDEYGVINFNYTHNMREEPCLVAGNKVLMKIQKDRQTFVVR